MNNKSERSFVRKMFWLTKSFVLLGMFTPSFVLATDREEVDPELMASSAHQWIAQEEEGKEVELGNAGYIFDRYPSVYLPAANHILFKVSPLGDQLELEDGSVWKISPYDSARALEWNSTNPYDPQSLASRSVAISQNTSWFSSYSFRIVNKSDHSSIAVNLFQGPWKGGELSRYIAEIDPFRGILKLSDATHWEIHPHDRASFFEWALSEPVLIGQNANYDASWNPYWEGLLINVRKTKKFVRAHQY